MRRQGFPSVRCNEVFAKWRATHFIFRNSYAMLIFVYFYFKIFFSVNLLLFIMASHPFLVCT